MSVAQGTGPQKSRTQQMSKHRKGNTMEQTKHKLSRILLGSAVALGMFASASNSASTASASTQSTGSWAFGATATTEPADESGEPVTVGPAGEAATPSSEIVLTEEEIAEVQEGTFTAALLWHTEGAFVTAVSNGVHAEFDRLGIEIVAETSAGFDSTKQASDVANVMALEPDIIVTLVVDPDAGAAAFQPAVDAGIKIVLLSNVPTGFVQGTDYVGLATDDLAGMGIAAADLLGESLGGSGQVGYIFHDASYYVTNQRDAAFKARLTQMYPDIEIVAEEGMADPAKAEEIASAMLTTHPEITGIYTPWSDGPADGVLAALRAADRPDIRLVTMDLSDNASLDLASGGNVVGIAADEAFELGRALATIGAYGVLDKETPPFVVVPAIAVTADNLVEAYMLSLNSEPPAAVTEALDD